MEAIFGLGALIRPELVDLQAVFLFIYFLFLLRVPQLIKSADLSHDVSNSSGPESESVLWHGTTLMQYEVVL